MIVWHAGVLPSAAQVAVVFVRNIGPFRLRTWPPQAKWVAQSALTVWRVAAPLSKWRSQPPTSVDPD